MKNKILLFIFMLLTSFGMSSAKSYEVEEPVIMTEKVKNPSGELGNYPKSPETTLLIYQNGNTFYFGESLAGNSITLIFNNVVVYSDVVGTDGTIIIPATFTGTFETMSHHRHTGILGRDRVVGYGIIGEAYALIAKT